MHTPTYTNDNVFTCVKTVNQKLKLRNFNPNFMEHNNHPLKVSSKFHNHDNSSFGWNVMLFLASKMEVYQSFQSNINYIFFYFPPHFLSNIWQNFFDTSYKTSHQDDIGFQNSNKRCIKISHGHILNDILSHLVCCLYVKSNCKWIYI